MYDENARKGWPIADGIDGTKYRTLFIRTIFRVSLLSVKRNKNHYFLIIILLLLFYRKPIAVNGRI